jgi:hypothetical protein
MASYYFPEDCVKKILLFAVLCAAFMGAGCGLVTVSQEFRAAGIEAKIDNATDGFYLPQINNRYRQPIGPGDSQTFGLSLQLNGWLQDPYRAEAPAPIGGKICGRIVRVTNVALPLHWMADRRFGVCAITPEWLESEPSGDEVAERITCIRNELERRRELGRKERIREMNAWLKGLDRRGIKVQDWDCAPDSFEHVLTPWAIDRQTYRYSMSAERRTLVLRGSRGQYSWEMSGW